MTTDRVALSFSVDVSAFHPGYDTDDKQLLISPVVLYANGSYITVLQSSNEFADYPAMRVSLNPSIIIIHSFSS